HDGDMTEALGHEANYTTGVLLFMGETRPVSSQLVPELLAALGRSGTQVLASWCQSYSLRSGGLARKS
ncbi:hypothetical protein NL346_28015, partial [Klebsiella pneumoniae]|nr:hypothetical protein [Klebsiella pneumoniae]